MIKLHIDLETYSSIDIRKSGAYRYCESIDFEILMIAYAFDDEQIKIVDLAQGEKIPKELHEAFLDENVLKYAHNAAFERTALAKIGYKIPIEQWRCSAIRAAYCGLPLSLEQVGKALKLDNDTAKLKSGKALIRFFCMPIKPTKTNGHRVRNFPRHDIEKWNEFKTYCVRDVEAERAICNDLQGYDLNEFERQNYILDQKINDRGIKVDKVMAQRMYDLDNIHSEELFNEMRLITNVDNPNSPAQLKSWLSNAMGREIKTLAKSNLAELQKEAGQGPVSELLELRSRTSKASTKKYQAILNCVCDDDRVHGLFQFYGANRTGRWAGRLVQLQNLPKDNLDNLEQTREIFRRGDYGEIKLQYDHDITSRISQLIRTAFIAEENFTFAVADFSAIEARVVAWLAHEKWRLDVFSDHGKIYEASASKMFNVPIEQVTKGSDLRAKGKNAELALGYQGSVGAMLRLGADRMGMSEPEMLAIVKKWRKANPAIVKFWYDSEKYAKEAFKKKKRVKTPFKGIEFEYDGRILKTYLPSGRHLSYYNPKMAVNKFGTMALKYQGMDQVTKKWWYIDTYGGKIVENIVQAVSRDILADSMMRLHKAGFDIVMHVHDEAICEIPKENADKKLKQMCAIMGEEIPWAKGLPLSAEGYITDYYKKD